MSSQENRLPIGNATGGGETSFDVFLSYHWRDHSQVEKVARTLIERGLRVFLDRWYLTPGRAWPQALEQTLASCGAVAVFLGADGLGPWQQRERDLALDRQGREPGFPVIPVLLTRTDPALGFLKLNTWVDLSADVVDQRALDTLYAAIRRRPPGPAGLTQTAAVRAEICPYRGLRPFREEDAAFFCGREAFTAKLIEAVDHSSLIAVVGASGSGKSSVVRAGLIPRLRESKATRVWEITTLVPTDRPLHSLAAALVPFLEPDLTPVDRLAEINKLAGHFAAGTVSLRDVAADVLRAQPGTDRLLLFVDQWEELYMLVAEDGARRCFLAELVDASAKGAVTVVSTLRADFFAQALSDRSFADRLQGGQVNLGPMTKEELRRSIVQPAEMVGLQFEPGLVDRILEDVGQEPGNLPLLEFVLAALWEQRQGAILLHDAYERWGGVQGAVAARADAEIEKLDASQQQAARRFLTQMVRPGEGTADTRQRALLPSGNVAALAVIRRLADARLVVTARDAVTGEETVEVTHEALIHNWALLRGWVDQDREFLRIKARIEAAAVLWEQEGRDASRLLATGRPLAEGKELLASHRTDLRAGVLAFIEASSAAATRIHRRTLVARAAALAAMLLAVTGSALYWDLKVGKHEEYYNSYAKRWGVLEPVGPLVGAEDAAQRSRTLRFVRKGRLGPVVRVDAIDGSGACARGGLPDLTSGVGAADPLGVWDSPTRICSIEWERDSQGLVTKQTMRDAKGRIQASLVYTDEGRHIADFRGPGGYILPIGVATTISYERIEEGPNRGQDQLERWTDASGQPKPFLGGAFATRVEYDEKGLLVRAVSLGLGDKPIRNFAGFAEVRVRYDNAGTPVEVSLFDERGHPARAQRGMASWTMRYDASGNEVEETYFDENGNRTRSKDGYARLTLAYDGRGQETRRTYLDEVGKPTRNKEGYAGIARKFDPHGRPVEEAYLDEKEKLTLSKNGYAKITKRYDESGNVVEENYLDQEGKRTRNKKGYAKITWGFDDRGRLVEEKYFDKAGKLTRSRDGCAKRTLAYDNRSDAPIAVECFDEMGNLTLSQDGYARTTNVYDASGQRVLETYYDEAKKLTLSKGGYAKIATTYDDQGNKVRDAYLDEGEKSTVTKSGFASVVFEHDARGNMVKQSYSDANGTPTRSKEEYASVVKTYDARGNVVEEAFFDEEGKPCLNGNSVAGNFLWYDERDNRVRLEYFDETGKPTLSKEGVARIISTYDPRGNVVEEAYFDEAGKPTRSKYKYARLVRTYDARGNAVEEDYFDQTGKRTAIDAGYAKIELVYDARGNQIENRYFDDESRATRSKNGYSRLTQAFDDRDNVVEQTFFDETGKLAQSKDGYAKVTMAYDARGNKTEQAFFEAAGSAMRSKDGYAKVTMAYDQRGNKVETAYFDEARKLVLSKEGYATGRTTYDARGNAVEGTYYDEAGHPTPNNDGVIAWTADYDERGRVIKARVLDEKGKPARSKDGYAMITNTYDSRGNRIRSAYSDEEGNPIRTKDGYASVAKRYDARGNVVEEAYFDEKSRPTRSKDGYAKIIKAYNSRGEVIERASFDEKGIAVREPRVPGGSLSTGSTS